MTNFSEIPSENLNLSPNTQVVKISPSLLSANISNLADDIKALENAGVEYVHVDVMDGHFVPNLTYGVPLVSALKNMTKITLDVHLMIDNPELFIEPFAKAGADLIVFHVEVVELNKIEEIIDKILRCGKLAGIAIKPSTLLSSELLATLQKVLPKLSLILQMTVEPGFGGQSFIEDTTDSLIKLREAINNFNPNCDLEVDGGINPSTAKIAINAGANVLVAGSSIFQNNGVQNNSEEINKAIKLLRNNQ
ncbi:MAG: ribulose-phosphate 3-epimerase [Clostridiales bacterium]|jgi:ribulose-phosphate 3-epimerase|nr:ribulose-phosphate 3-epimerase [Clostridiales bacterium]